MNKELRKSNVDRKIAGVCSGIAEYVGIDVGTVRALTVVAALFIKHVVLAYIVLALVLPSDE